MQNPQAGWKNGASTKQDTSTSKAEEFLRSIFGFKAFRGFQKEAVVVTLSGRDLFIRLSTGSGKSLCFQLPALMQPTVTVVVSPLLALIEGW